MEQAILDFKAKISKHRDYYNNNETAVRRQLIEPILDFLGWHSHDPSYVQLNSQTDERDIPDYTLLRENHIETYVEAKNLSANISNHISQLARYCINQGKEFGILTNGNDWLLIKTFEKDTKLRDRIIWQISLENDNVSTIQSRLTTISFDQISSLPELIEKEKQLNKFWNEYVLNENKIVDKLSLEITDGFLNKFPDDDYDREAAINFFKLKLLSFLTDKIIGESQTNSEFNNQYKQQSKKQNENFNFSRLKKAGTPSVRDWIDKIPELKRVDGLNSWRDICDYLGIPVEGDSARRRLKKWIEINRKNWIQISEPKK